MIVTVDHARRSTQKIAKLVGQVGIVGVDESLPGEIAIFSSFYFTQQIIAEGVAAVLLGNIQQGFTPFRRHGNAGGVLESRRYVNKLGMLAQHDLLQPVNLYPSIIQWNRYGRNAPGRYKVE